jgi:hypothetical protein
MPMALMHAASAELGAGRVSDTDAGPALVTTILGAVSGGRPMNSGDGPRGERSARARRGREGRTLNSAEVSDAR